MMNRYLTKCGCLRYAISLAQAAIIVLVAGTAFAADAPGQKVVDGIQIYYAVTPAEIIRGYPKDAPEASMHGGMPVGRHYHHVMVALFESKSLDRITDAKVTARVREIGLSGVEKELEPIMIAGALTYGNYFKMPSLTIYKIDLAIRRPGFPHIVETSFEFRHH